MEIRWYWVVGRGLVVWSEEWLGVRVLGDERFIIYRLRLLEKLMFLFIFFSIIERSRVFVMVFFIWL